MKATIDFLFIHYNSDVLPISNNEQLPESLMFIYY